jgi:L-aspartate oxidase
VSATGAHGANRLASNSLLEALVFGARVAEDLRSALPLPASAAVSPALLRAASARQPMLWAPGDGELTLAVRKRMWEQVGLMRDEAGLRAAVADLERLAARHPRAAGEARNLLALGRLVTAAALARRESRGGHFRSDFPAADPIWQRRLFLTAEPDGSARFEALPTDREEREPLLALAAAGGRP